MSSMFVYLSKKVQVPGQLKVRCVGWDKAEGWVAVGGQKGMLRVFQFTGANSDAGSGNIQALQLLEGHNDTVMVIAWNELYRKLTTSDAAGSIIVFVHKDGKWVEEMTNNRKKSVVHDMKWTPDGTRICIAYEDGAVIVGGVNGTRHWSSELNMNISMMEWSPSAQVILFASATGDVHIYDAAGSPIGKLKNYTHQSDEDPSASLSPVKVVGMCWYDGTFGRDPNTPCLAVAYDTGKVQILRHEQDENPVLIDTGLICHSCKWNAAGTILAISGTSMSSGSSLSSSLNVNSLSASFSGNPLTNNTTSAGNSSSSGKMAVVQFYNAEGKHLRTLPIVAGDALVTVAWEVTGLRLVLGVDSCIYFATVRGLYQWCSLANSVIVYAFRRVDRDDMCLTFWNSVTNERHTKYVPNLLGLKGCGEHCVVATRVDEGALAAVASSGASPARYCLILCNGVGLAVESRYIDIEPKFLTITESHVIAASSEAVHVWEFDQPSSASSSSVSIVSAANNALSKVYETIAKNPEGADLGLGLGSTSSVAASRRRELFECAFHVDDGPISAAAAAAAAANASVGLASSQKAINTIATGSTPGAPGVVQSFVPLAKLLRSTSNPIVAIAASDACLIVARASGSLTRYALPSVTEEAKLYVKTRPEVIQLNCNSTKLSIIDHNGVLSFTDVGGAATTTSLSTFSANSSSSSQNTSSISLPSERQNVWDMKWSDDDPSLFATMERGRMYIFRGSSPEEPVQSNAYLCEFKDLCIRTVALDEVMHDPDNPNKDHVVLFETKTLRDTRQLLSTCPLQEACAFIEENPHPRLWRLLAEWSLKQLDFKLAERAFVACQDYAGIQCARRLRLINDPSLQLAEVAAHFSRFDEAETIYMEAGREDLAVGLRQKLGDWIRVVQILTASGARPLPGPVAASAMINYTSGSGSSTKAIGSDVSTSDLLLTQALHNMGEYYAERQRWRKARSYFQQSHSLERLAQCMILLDDYEGLPELLSELPEGSGVSILKPLAESLASAGLVHEATEVYLKAEDPKAAVDVCITMGEWALAVELAEKHKMPQISDLLARYAAHLLQRERLLQALILYRKATNHSNSARLLAEVARRAKSGALSTISLSVSLTSNKPLRNSSVSGNQRARGLLNNRSSYRSVATAAGYSPLLVKKLYVMSALEAVANRQQQMRIAQTQGIDSESKIMQTASANAGTSSAATIAAATNTALRTMLESESRIASSTLDAGRIGGAAAMMEFEQPWHGAEAMHFWLLAHRQLYGGDPRSAARTASRLVEYEDILDPREIQSLIALTTFYAGLYGQCSKSFISLEAMPSIELMNYGGSTTGNEQNRGVSSTFSSASGSGNISSKSESGNSQGSSNSSQAYDELALSIFLRHPPRDPTSSSAAPSSSLVPPVNYIACPKCHASCSEFDSRCGECSRVLPICIVTGQLIPATTPTMTCRTCNGCGIEQHMRLLRVCPLCHQYLRQSQVAENSNANGRGSQTSQTTGAVSAKPGLNVKPSSVRKTSAEALDSSLNMSEIVDIPVISAEQHADL